MILELIQEEKKNRKETSFFNRTHAFAFASFLKQASGGRLLIKKIEKTINYEALVP